ncbi:hypothetical protein WA026_006587 [Henosepilachna vigintioctopunctata]|uniref:Maf-like protein n=1 Tax=Henosepilachna vigintioctopunctata TaxID=420089 RepID=A0AAW1UFQ7_9CUCU
MLQPLIGKLNDIRVVLASSSKQREQLLKSINLKFEIIPSDFEENLNPSEHTFSDFVENTARGKTSNVYEKLKNETPKPGMIIGVDTMVTFDGKMYGKPKNNEDAIRIIKDLTQSGLPNDVYTGVAIWYNNKIHTFTEVTTVYMAKLSNEEIESYVSTGEPLVNFTFK